MTYKPLKTFNTGKQFFVDAKDYHKISKDEWWENRSGYVATWDESKLLHRLIMKPAKNQFIDHINGNKLDNRRCNLRICTHAENMRNRTKHKLMSSQYKGVYYTEDRKNKWRAQIVKDKKKYHLGSYQTEIEAAKAYNRAAKELHKEFAKLNKIHVDTEGAVG